jgi:Arc/MetJ-type ribon-helix-helix transcriptional regulator
MTVMTTVRMPKKLVEELKTLAAEQNGCDRLGERVSFGSLVREGARLVLDRARRRASVRART